MNNRPLDLNAVIFDFDGTLALLNIDFKEMRLDILDLAASYGISDVGMERLFVLEMIAEMRERIGQRSPGQEGAFSGRALRLVSRPGGGGCRQQPPVSGREGDASWN